MSRRWYSLALLAMMTTVLLTSGCGGDGASDLNATHPVKILRHEAGNDATLQLGVYLIKNSAELADTGSAELAHVDVDFDRQSLVVVALGEKNSGGYWVKIHGVQLRGNKLFVQTTMGEPAANAAVTTALTYPWAAVVVPRTHASELVHEPLRAR